MYVCVNNQFVWPSVIVACNGYMHDCMFTSSFFSLCRRYCATLAQRLTYVMHGYINWNSFIYSPSGSRLYSFYQRIPGSSSVENFCIFDIFFQDFSRLFLHLHEIARSEKLKMWKSASKRPVKGCWVSTLEYKNANINHKNVTKDYHYMPDDSY